VAVLAMMLAWTGSKSSLDAQRPWGDAVNTSAVTTTIGWFVGGILWLGQWAEDDREDHGGESGASHRRRIFAASTLVGTSVGVALPLLSPEHFGGPVDPGWTMVAGGYTGLWASASAAYLLGAGRSAGLTAAVGGLVGGAVFGLWAGRTQNRIAPRSSESSDAGAGGVTWAILPPLPRPLPGSGRNLRIGFDVLRVSF